MHIEKHSKRITDNFNLNQENVKSFKLVDEQIIDLKMKLDQELDACCAKME